MFRCRDEDPNARETFSLALKPAHTIGFTRELIRQNLDRVALFATGTRCRTCMGSSATHRLRSDQVGWEQVQPMRDLTVTAKSDSAEYRTQTADDGLYRFRGLPSGRHQLSVAAPPGRRALWEGNAENPGAGPGVPCAMNFEVFWGGLITGTVIGRDGQPASGMITAQYVGPETPPAGPFGAYVKDGRFEILRLPPGRYSLMFLPIVADRPAGPEVYYPCTQGHSAAALIEVDEGAHVEGLLFTVF